MPLTFFAHQAPVLPLKIARPRWFDGTALCVGAMAPDFAYPLGPWLSRQSHTAIGVVIWGVPCTLVVCFAIRRYVATTAWAHLPDTSWLRLHSYRVLAHRRPPIRQTIVGGIVGAGSHAFLDGFTHLGRFGASWAGTDDVFVSVPVRGAVSLTRAFQYGGHTLGSLAAIALLVLIARRRLLEQWYGADLVGAVRRFSLQVPQRVLFWSVSAAGMPLGLWWASMTSGVKPFRVIDAVAVTTAVACLLPWTRPREADPVRSPDAELPVGRRRPAPE